MAQLSVTLPDHVDQYLETLSAELKISKSGLGATAIELGIAVYVKSLIIDRRECEAILAQAAKTRDKALAGPSKGRKSNVSIEYVAETATD
jgi:hypothetical protein